MNFFKALAQNIYYTFGYWTKKFVFLALELSFNNRKVFKINI